MLRQPLVRLAIYLIGVLHAVGMVWLAPYGPWALALSCIATGIIIALVPPERRAK